MWVVKLGGSLLDYSGLSDWLEALANAPRPVVIVVGGGPLAAGLVREGPNGDTGGTTPRRDSHGR